MAGLFFLWQNIPSIPPVIVYTDYSIKPVMSMVGIDVSMDIEYSPKLEMVIQRLSPSVLMQSSDNTFTDVTTAWSDSTVTWSDSTALWGGSDRKGADAPVFARIDTVRPILIR